MSTTFDHPDYINSKGEVIPSVTQILAVLNHPHVIAWANYLGLCKHLKVDEWLDHVAFRGSIIHERIAKNLVGEKSPDVYDLNTEAECEVLYSRFETWRDEAEPKPIVIEKRYQNEDFGGTVDLVCETKQGPVILIDFKTASEPKAQNMLQLGAYLILIEENDPELYKKIDMCQIITLGGKDLKITTRVKAEMKKYKKAFKEIFAAYKAWKEILSDRWKEKLPK